LYFGEIMLGIEPASCGAAFFDYSSLTYVAITLFSLIRHIVAYDKKVGWLVYNLVLKGEEGEL
jgi:hypothetical protein